MRAAVTMACEVCFSSGLVTLSVTSNEPFLKKKKKKLPKMHNMLLSLLSIKSSELCHHLLFFVSCVTRKEKVMQSVCVAHTGCHCVFMRAGIFQTLFCLEFLTRGGKVWLRHGTLIIRTHRMAEDDKLKNSLERSWKTSFPYIKSVNFLFYVNYYIPTNYFDRNANSARLKMSIWKLVFWWSIVKKWHVSVKCMKLTPQIGLKSIR